MWWLAGALRWGLLRLAGLLALLLFALVARLLGWLEWAKAHGLLQWLQEQAQPQRLPRRRFRLRVRIGRKGQLLAR